MSNNVARKLATYFKCMREDPARRQLRESIENNLPDWKLLVHDAEIVNKGAYSHVMHKNMAYLKWFMETWNKTPEKIKGADFGAAGSNAANLAYHLYLLSKGR